MTLLRAASLGLLVGCAPTSPTPTPNPAPPIEEKEDAGPSRPPGCARQDCKTGEIVDDGCIHEKGRVWCASCVEACPEDLPKAGPPEPPRQR